MKKEKHGMSYSPEYYCWLDMKKRCTKSNRWDYSYYGGRGISIYPKWVNSFISFFNDMGPRPSKNHSIDRIDNDGNYEPGNCRWATRKQQARNKRKQKNKSGLAGVAIIRGNKYQVYYKTKYIGYFDNIFDAACARLSLEAKEEARYWK